MSTVSTTRSPSHVSTALAALLTGAVVLTLAIAVFLAVDDGSASSSVVPSATRPATTVEARQGSADALERQAETFASDRSSFGGPDAAERWLHDRAG